MAAAEGARPQRRRVATGVEIAYRMAGSGTPLLLLHGYPQNNLMWSRLLPALSERFTVVASDLRGYGDSDKPRSDARHEAYSFRAMAQDQAALMEHLGFDVFAVAGHDRGGRVAHRLCLDHPERVSRAAVLDIAPTLTMFERTDMAFAMAYYHWFFLAQPAPLPEKLIGAEPAFYLRRVLASWSRPDPQRLEEVFDARCVLDYERCFSDPAAIHASCEDYRAAAGIDLVHDRADRDAARRIRCPLLALWGEYGLIARTYDVLQVWRAASEAEPSGRALPCGHFLPEEAPAQTLEALLEFFDR